MNVEDTIVNTNTSVYNSNKIIDKCEICNKKCLVHHINEQHTADENGIIDNFHKNSPPILYHCTNVIITFIMENFL